MKKICFVLLLMIFLLSGIGLAKANETGHKNVESIDIPENVDVYLLVNTSIGDKQKIQKKVPWKFIGWETYVNVKKQDVTYKKFDTFSRSNMTSNVIKFDYTFTDVKSVETSIELDSSLKRSASGKIYVVNAALDNTIKAAVGSTVEITTTKQLKYSITVSPYTKVSVSIKGEGKLSSGAAKYYFFGATIYKGNWEYLDYVTEYYELYEEKLM